jgi:hypothetical protein
MRSAMIFGTLGLALLFATPSSAQMCGPGQAGAATAGAGMCGGMTTGQAPSAAPEQSKPQQSGMCGCCRNMAMMMGPQSGQGGTMQMPGMTMPGMEMPKPQ